MFASIPASQIVKINPAVLGTGGEGLDLNTVVITDEGHYATSEYSSATDVADVFGYSSPQYQFALSYFEGYVGSTVKPKKLFLVRFNLQDHKAKLIGATVRELTLDELKSLNGSLELTIDGKRITESINLSEATSFSDAAAIISKALKVSVEFDAQLQAFIIQSTNLGANASISYAVGDVAETLGLTEQTGAVVDNQVEIDSVDSIMKKITSYTLNFATITTIGDGFNVNHFKELAIWNSKQNNRYWFVHYSEEPIALIANNSKCFGQWLKNHAINGTTAIYGTLEQAALACGYAASINFREVNGRSTMEFKRQAGIAPSITSLKDAEALESNGYAYYGAWATANERFIFFKNTRVSGDFKWVDAYLNQIYLNSQLQLAFVNMLMNYKSVPYNFEGIAIHRAAAQDPINEMLNFGGIQTGINLSEAQTQQINYEAKFDAARQLKTQGYCLLITQAAAQVRGNRQSLPMKLWYTDGGSVHSVNLASINVQ